jgi:hypothetical protein
MKILLIIPAFLSILILASCDPEYIKISEEDQKKYHTFFEVEAVTTQYDDEFVVDMVRASLDGKEREVEKRKVERIEFIISSPEEFAGETKVMIKIEGDKLDLKKDEKISFETTRFNFDPKMKEVHFQQVKNFKIKEPNKAGIGISSSSASRNPIP